jgi:hypothetical protein
MHLLDRIALELDELGLGEGPPLYGRVCDVCGHYELSEDPLLVVGWRKCPSCSVRNGGHA